MTCCALSGCRLAMPDRGSSEPANWLNSQREAYGGDGLRGDAFGTAGEAKLFGRRRLDADATGRNAKDRGHPLDHSRTVRCDLRPLADDRHIDRGDHAALRLHESRGMAQELIGSRAAPTGIGGWKMHADVAGPDCAGNRVGQRVQSNISVGVPSEAHAVRDFDATYPDMIPRGERVHVEALPDTDITEPGGD